MKIISRAAWIVALCLGSNLSWAQTLPQTLNVSFGCSTLTGQHTYEIWLYNGLAVADDKTWEKADDFAARELRGELGHLVTFADADEETCVLDRAAALGLVENQQLWIGLVQGGVGPEPAGGWEWVTGENILGYTNWASSEPNNSGGNENHGTIGRYGYALADGWNDESDTRGSVVGLVIEYDVDASGPIPLDCDPITLECEIQIPSANPANNTITLPSGFGGTADVQIVLIQEDVALCSSPYDPLGVRDITFRLPGEGSDTTIKVPNYLCAKSGEWTLISSKLADVNISEGVIEGRFDPLDFGLISNGCAADYLPGTLNRLKSDLLAHLPSKHYWGVSEAARNNDHLQDFTYAKCGSSRIRTDSNQFFAIGLNYNYDPDGDVDGEFRMRTINDLELLQEWADEARTLDVIKQGDFSKMTQKIQGAIVDIGLLDFLAASQKIEDLFDKFLDAANFKNPGLPGSAVNDYNWQGEGIARSSHILDMLNVYLIPFSQ